jgi:YVTN family beta-propeller protein
VIGALGAQRRRSAPRILAVVLALCAGVIWHPPSAAAHPGASRPVLFTANSVAGTVTLIDARSLKRLGRINIIPDGKTPQDPTQAMIYPALVKAQGLNYAQGIAISPNGKVLYVSRGYFGDVAAFKIATGKELWRLQTSSLRADHVALSPNGRRLFVSALTSNDVQVIDTRTHQFIGSFPTGTWAHVDEFSPDGRFIYNGSLGNQLLPQGEDGAKQLTVANAKTLRVVRTFQFDAGVRPFVFTPNGRRMFIQLSFLNGFIEFNPQTGKTLRTVHLPISGPGRNLPPDQYPNDAAHHGIAISRDGRYICDAATISNYAALVKRSSLKMVAKIPVGDEPAEAETSLDGRYCFITSRGPKANTVSVISYAKRREVKRIRVGRHPQEEQEAKLPDAVLRRGGFLK